MTVPQSILLGTTIIAASTIGAGPQTSILRREVASAFKKSVWHLDHLRREIGVYGYSRFCDLYVEWRHGITATMRQTRAAGEKLFVDFAGDTVPVFDGLTGEVGV